MIGAPLTDLALGRVNDVHAGSASGLATLPYVIGGLLARWALMFLLPRPATHLARADGCRLTGGRHYGAMSSGQGKQDWPAPDRGAAALPVPGAARSGP